jgi:hypothetical protein
MAAPKGNRYAAGGPGGGRPTRYRTPYHDDLVYQLAIGGSSRAEIFNALKISESTYDLWRHKHKNFSGALERAREYADSAVEKSLFHRACGFKHPDVHISLYEGDVIQTEITKQYPPDTNAAKFWLVNRQPRRWRDKQQHDVMALSTVTHEVGDSVSAMMLRLRQERRTAQAAG